MQNKIIPNREKNINQKKIGYLSNGDIDASISIGDVSRPWLI